MPSCCCTRQRWKLWTSLLMRSTWCPSEVRTTAGKWAPSFTSLLGETRILKSEMKIKCTRLHTPDVLLPAEWWCGTLRASRPSVGVRPGAGGAAPASPCSSATPPATASSQLGGEDEAAFGISHRSHVSFWFFFLFAVQRSKCGSWTP